VAGQPSMSAEAARDMIGVRPNSAVPVRPTCPPSIWVSSWAP
jgi:hypothetical protein